MDELERRTKQVAANLPPWRSWGRSLTNEEVRFIRAAKGRYTARALAASLGVCTKTVRRVWNGHSYKDVE